MVAGKFKATNCEDIEPGDIVQVMEDEQTPADLVILATDHDEEGLCYVETMNLDGETNLKPRRSSAVTSGLKDQTKVASLLCKLDVEEPNEALDTFKGSVQLLKGEGDPPFGEKTGIDQKGLLLRGTILRNTKWIYGVCVYAGVDTKIVRNAKPAASKFSQLEKLLNLFVLGLFLTQITVNLVWCLMAGSVYEGLAGVPGSEGTPDGVVPEEAPYLELWRYTPDSSNMYSPNGDGSGQKIMEVGCYTYHSFFFFFFSFFVFFLSP